MLTFIMVWLIFKKYFEQSRFSNKINKKFTSDFMKKCYLHRVGIYKKFHQNWFIAKYVRKIFGKIL